MDNYVFTMWLSVHTPEALRQAALAHEDAAPSDTFLREDGTVDIEACLVMMLDPSSLPGCTVQSSTASEDCGD